MQEGFAEKLGRTYQEFDKNNIEELGKGLLKAYRDFASRVYDLEEPSRLSLVEYGLVSPPEANDLFEVYGARIKGKNLLVNYIIHETEGLHLGELKGFSLNINEQEWDALMRTVTLTMSAFDRMRRTAAFWQIRGVDPSEADEEKYDASQHELAETLVSVCFAGTEQDLNVLTRELRRAFLRYGSETPDNSAAMELIEYGPERMDLPVGRIGLRLRNTPVFASDVVRHLLGLAMPEGMPEYLIDLTEDEWKAALELTYLTLLAFEQPG